MNKIKYLAIIVSFLITPYIVNAEECPAYSNTYSIMDQEGNEADNKYNIGDKLYLKVSFANVYTSVSQGLKFDSSTFKFIEAKTSENYNVNYSNLNNITISRNYFSNNSAYITYTLEVIGLNNAAIEVINQSGTCENNQKVNGDSLKYTAKLYSGNNELSSLLFSEGFLDKEFSKEELNYTLTIPKNTKEINIKATPQENTATVTGDINNINIENKKELVINVTSESGTTRKYLITLNTPKDDITESPYLKKLVASSGVISFLSDTFNYSITVPFSTTYFEISAVPQDYRTTYQLEGNGDIQVGDNIIRIVTNSVSGQSATYTINVKRLSETELEENKKDTNYLASLEIENETIQFDKNINDYQLTLSELSDLNIKAIPETTGATVTIQGNNNLENNSVISIIVTGLDENNREYRILIKDANYKENNNQLEENNEEQNSNTPKKTNNSFLIITLIIISTIVLIIICGFFLRRNKKI